MALLGNAALAMWWDVAPPHRTEFEDWHSHEHFPERLHIPGFLRGSRWSSATGQEGFFVMYELEAYETLTSSQYLSRLNNPTPWSSKMMPHHRNMVRSQCRIMDSFGGGIAGRLITIRLSPETEIGNSIRGLLQDILSKVPNRVGLTSGHLLKTDTPKAAQTKEQALRGGTDGVASWIVLVFGYDARALEDISRAELSSAALSISGAQPDLYRLSYAMTPRDL